VRSPIPPPVGSAGLASFLAGFPILFPFNPAGQNRLCVLITSPRFTLDLASMIVKNSIVQGL